MSSLAPPDVTGLGFFICSQGDGGDGSYKRGGKPWGAQHPEPWERGTPLGSDQGKRGGSETSLSCGASKHSREGGHRVLQMNIFVARPQTPVLACGDPGQHSPNWKDEKELLCNY